MATATATTVSIITTVKSRAETEIVGGIETGTDADIMILGRVRVIVRMILETDEGGGGLAVVGVVVVVGFSCLLRRRSRLRVGMWCLTSRISRCFWLMRFG